MRRFWEKVDKAGPIPAHVPELGPCWLWTAGRFNTGYGQIRIEGRNVLAHRCAWELTFGAIPIGDGPHGTCVLHRCDVRLCVNPTHLFLGSHQTNIADRDAKDRTQKGNRHWSRMHPERRARGDANGSRLHPELRARGARNGSAKITDADVAAIRARRANGELQHTIALEYGISRSQVSSIELGKTWKHVK